MKIFAAAFAAGLLACGAANAAGGVFLYDPVTSQGFGASNPLPMSSPVGSANLGTNQATVTGSATLIVAARTGAPGTGRIAVTVFNNSSGTVYIGGSGVTTSTGLQIPVGASVTLNTTAAIYGIAASGSNNVGYAETY